MQVVVDSLLTQYQESGSGKTVLLLHGWGDSSTSFQALQTNLQNEYQVIALDLPGFGKTQTPQEVWGLNDYADFVSRFIEKIQAEPFAIIGHSNGGAIAIRGITTAKLSPSKLILLASAGIRGEYRGRVKAIRLVTKTGKVLTAPFPKSIKQKLRKKVYSSVGSDMLVAEHLQETFKKVVLDDVRKDATQLNIPTLLIYGDHDEQTPYHYGEIFKDLIPESKLIKVQHASHFLHQEEPNVIGNEIKEFLK